MMAFVSSAWAHPTDCRVESSRRVWCSAPNRSMAAKARTTRCVSLKMNGEAGDAPLTLPPRDYPQLYVQSLEAIRAALKEKVQFLELEFPALRNMATSALNQIADANREHARALATALAADKDAGTVCLVFPDAKEAALATKVFGESTVLPFEVGSLAAAATMQAEREQPAGSTRTLFVVVNPGFNIEEWLQLESLHLGHPSDPILVINGGMDRVRSGYYPRLFYPKLHQTKDRFLCKFEPVFFYKPFGSGLGTLYRKFPADWQTLFHVKDGGGYRLLSQDAQRPEYKVVEQNFRAESIAVYQKRT
ncbi:Protein LOW PSII ACCUMULATION 3, chloroplastic [Porphyridium purpureum]|uniref:Protein LOW PSII ACCUMULATION 3, chloroplastic n=1 Tax=Porphyridium purpureum TaxID=35688 RepID=A0A5J4Z109_PORPP|nr:Protein LOW PSII ACCUMULATION 3, chloroplastic [Porphyridium purpureum]|eukprot:POR3999..scf208_2